MCTAVTYQTRDFYFGRTLDNDTAYSLNVTVTPRNFPLPFRHGETLSRHYAILGMAHIAEGYPLYFDAVNEKGLAMAALNFPGYAHYNTVLPDRNNIAVFEFLPCILGRCASVAEARCLLEDLNLTDTAFREDLPPTPLHWLLADRHEVLTIESLRDGLKVYPNPVGVLTNNPPFPDQLLRLTDFLSLTPEEPINRFSDTLDLKPYSRGMGAMGLPGDLSSPSRFVRAAFTKLNSCSGISEAESVNQFFHIMSSVEQVRGCCRLDGGKFELTQYTSCYNTDKGICYYRTYPNHQINAVALRHTLAEKQELICYPLIAEEKIRMQN